MPNIAAIDLNLLVALEALLKERNVTRAGKRIGLTQSATSHALKRLRELIGDQLLVKSGHDLKPTTFAEELEPKISRLLQDIRETLIGGARFEPKTDHRTFTISSDDYCGLVLLPPLIAHLRRLAPRVELRIRPLGQNSPYEALASGELDLAIGTYLRPPRLIESARSRATTAPDSSHRASVTMAWSSSTAWKWLCTPQRSTRARASWSSVQWPPDRLRSLR